MSLVILTPILIVLEELVIVERFLSFSFENGASVRSRNVFRILGRAGEKGTAYTLITEKDKDFAGHLIRNLESVNQEVPNALLELAMQVTFLLLENEFRNVVRILK